ncbi:helix-turn-helix domain-containing protein [Streptomyces sp. NPDC001980]|uniref:helix-turn-helix domain-containing protein n=1 Tax=Streptomyces sp. NPDC001980 TaxID=3157126 RepID=UPI00331B2873
MTHVNVRLTTRYTVVDNRLLQHRALSLTAIGLAGHIQSLPTGARIDIKSLTARFPEGEVRIAAALRELEAHGYLSRTRERPPNGRVVSRTVSYNRPTGVEEVREVTPPPPPPPPPRPERAQPPAAPPPRPPEPPLPEPTRGAPDPRRTATTLLSRLHHDDPRLLLPEREVRRLAPAVDAWLERRASPDAVRRTLTSCLPAEPLRHPAGLLAHRLTEYLPPPPPPAPPRPLPFQDCDGCDRPFRAAEPGRCRERPDHPTPRPYDYDERPRFPSWSAPRTKRCTGSSSRIRGSSPEP